jgi:hypothetical protein
MIQTKPPLAWTEVSANLENFRYLRYRGPDGSYGNVAEIEFYRKGLKVRGVGFGTPGAWNNNGNTFAKAIDGNVGTRFDGPTANGVYVGVDTKASASVAPPLHKKAGRGVAAALPAPLLSAANQKGRPGYPQESSSEFRGAISGCWL